MTTTSVKPWQHFAQQSNSHLVQFTDLPNDSDHFGVFYFDQNAFGYEMLNIRLYKIHKRTQSCELILEFAPQKKMTNFILTHSRNDANMVECFYWHEYMSGSILFDLDSKGIFFESFNK